MSDIIDLTVEVVKYFDFLYFLKEYFSFFLLILISK
jgi:hypothetical protein